MVHAGKIEDLTAEQLTEMRLDLQRQVSERREAMRAVSKELDRRHDLDLAKKLAGDLNPAQRSAVLAELQAAVK